MSTTEPRRPTDGHGTGGATGPGEGPDTGRHAVQRPAPAPPGPATPGRQETTGTTDVTGTTGVTATPDQATPADPAPVRTGPRGRKDTSSPGEDPDDELFPDPHAPRTPHTGTHVLGTLLGIVLAPFATGLLLLGQSRILRVQVDGWDASLELLGIVLVSAGTLLLLVLLLLGAWSAAVPTAAGVVVAALGGLQLYAPGIARGVTLDVVGADAWFQVVTQATVAGTSGTTFAAGTMLLTAGVVTALARRHGVRLGAFRERNRSV